VLGHEVSHAIARHGGERISQTLLVQTGLAATQVALSNRDPRTTQAVTALLGAGATVGLLLPWSRAQESEAGYPPSAARGSGWARPRRGAAATRVPVA
jgi:metalloendopeptidase OMA1, mitochondrial